MAARANVPAWQDKTEAYTWPEVLAEARDIAVVDEQREARHERVALSDWALLVENQQQRIDFLARRPRCSQGDGVVAEHQRRQRTAQVLSYLRRIPEQQVDLAAKSRENTEGIELAVVSVEELVVQKRLSFRPEHSVQRSLKVLEQQIAAGLDAARLRRSEEWLVQQNVAAAQRRLHGEPEWQLGAAMARESVPAS